MSEHVARLKRVLDESYGFDVEMDRGISEPLTALEIIENEHTALKRAKEYVEEVCEEDFVMWCREQDDLLTAEEQP